MKVTPYTLPFPLTMNDPHRGEGLHVSDIYGSLYQDLEPERYRKDGTPPDLLMALGMAWEQYLEKTLIANGVLCARPGEQMTDDGLKYSPDLFIVNGEERLGEIKCTWLSAKVGPAHKKFDKFLCQGKAYAYFMGIPRVRYFVLHVNGNWSFKEEGGHFPMLRIWDCDFTAQELKDNYRLLMNHGKDQGMLDRKHQPVTTWRRT